MKVKKKKKNGAWVLVCCRCLSPFSVQDYHQVYQLPNECNRCNTVQSISDVLDITISNDKANNKANNVVSVWLKFLKLKRDPNQKYSIYFDLKKIFVRQQNTVSVFWLFFFWQAIHLSNNEQLNSDLFWSKIAWKLAKHFCKLEIMWNFTFNLLKP